MHATFNPSTQELEAGGSEVEGYLSTQWVQRHPALCEILSQKQIKEMKCVSIVSDGLGWRVMSLYFIQIPFGIITHLLDMISSGKLAQQNSSRAFLTNPCLSSLSLSWPHCVRQCGLCPLQICAWWERVSWTVKFCWEVSDSICGSRKAF